MYRKMISHADEYKQMLESLAFYEPRKAVKDAILAAYNSTDWDWQKSDGCTIVSECNYPKGYKFPPCVAHDYYCDKSNKAATIIGRERIRVYGDKILFWGHMDYGQPFRAVSRWVGVRLRWLAWGLWQQAS